MTIEPTQTPSGASNSTQNKPERTRHEPATVRHTEVVVAADADGRLGRGAAAPAPDLDGGTAGRARTVPGQTVTMSWKRRHVAGSRRRAGWPRSARAAWRAGPQRSACRTSSARSSPQRSRAAHHRSGRRRAGAAGPGSARSSGSSLVGMTSLADRGGHTVGAGRSRAKAAARGLRRRPGPSRTHGGVDGPTPCRYQRSERRAGGETVDLGRIVARLGRLARHRPPDQVESARRRRVARRVDPAPERRHVAVGLSPSRRSRAAAPSSILAAPPFLVVPGSPARSRDTARWPGLATT